jgi:hypothetical protein
MGVVSQFDLISLIIILVASAIFVLMTAPAGETARQKAAAIGGCAFLLWAILRLIAYLTGHGTA